MLPSNSFGKSNISISRLGYGAMGLSGSFGSMEESEFIQSIHRSLELGVNFIDTARAYGPSEETIGKALKTWDGPQPFIATKVKPCGKGGWGSPIPVIEAYPPGSIQASVDASLQALGVEALDLIQMHQYWSAWDDEPYWLEEMVKLKEAGKVKYIGISIPDHRHDMALSLVKSGKIDSVQSILNIFDPIALDNLVPLCEKHGVAFIARCVLDEGGLTGLLSSDTTFTERDFRNGYFDAGPRSEYIARVERLRSFIPQYASSLAALAIKYALHAPGVTTSIISMHIKEYAEQNAAALQEDPLPDEVVDELYKRHRWIRNFYERKYWK
ncbi:aldo/keto reductase [Paenibacillus roseipurpureus]|uniref:Aldo/keto reductase n=1 Tax=Paenibacillus roseopurpureus TaxID=2918901 RepID=A0AA96LJE9_9BACL|nr:aldo/keto reductase [Paenibacillus sp. MBLB1832]WNR42977.1 aldo/keto reductase [Paenibacillus sp. MBLB1832]